MYLNHGNPRRRGAAALLIVFMMFVFVVTAAITVDYSYMQLIRTELRACSDAAAKAGAEALSRTQSVGEAKKEAVRYAALNTVGGKPFQLSPSDVIIGRVNASGSGKWAFEANGTPPNAVRINARIGQGSAQPAVPLFFSPIVGHSGFTPSHQTTAGQQEVEICLCLDRSGSMCFDMTGKDYSFAPNNPLLLNVLNFLGYILQNMLSPPHPTGSRWAALDGAIDVFVSEIGQLGSAPRTGVVTWGSDSQLPIPPYTVYQAATKNVPLPASSGFSWTANANAIQGVVSNIGGAALVGGTNLSAGMDAAVQVLIGPNSSSFSSKVIVLLTDGEWNEGRDPLSAARDARSQGVIIHCVSMLTTSQPVLQQIADITGGRYYKTTDAAGLRSAFKEIARSLPVVITE